MAQMVAAYKQLKTYSDQTEVRFIGGKSRPVIQASLAFAQPAKIAFIAKEGEKSSSRISDGTTYFSHSSTDQGQYLKSLVPSQKFGREALMQHQAAGDVFTALLAGLDPFQPPWGHSPRSLTLASPTTINGERVDIVVARFEDEYGGSGETIAYQMSQRDHLLRRLVISSGSSEKIVRTIETHSNVKINPQLPATTFAFTPPAESRAVERLSPPTWDKRLTVGTAPIPLAAVDTAGQPFSLEQNKGKATLIVFWATWCPYCRREVPHLVESYKKYHDKGLEIVGVSLDSDLDKLKEFTARHEMPWRQLCDGKRWQSEFAKLYGVRSLPFAMLVGRDGKIAAIGISRLQFDTAVAAALEGKSTGSGSAEGTCADCGTK